MKVTIVPIVIGALGTLTKGLLKGLTSGNWRTWNDPQRIIKRTGGVENLRTSWDHSNYIIVEAGQNTEKSLETFS